MSCPCSTSVCTEDEELVKEIQNDGRDCSYPDDVSLIPLLNIRLTLFVLDMGLIMQVNLLLNVNMQLLIIDAVTIVE